MDANPENGTALQELEISETERYVKGGTLPSAPNIHAKHNWKYPVLYFAIAAVVHLTVLGFLVLADLPASTTQSINADAVSGSSFAHNETPATNPFNEDTLRITQKILDGHITEPDANKLLQALERLNVLASSAGNGVEELSIPQNTFELLREFGLLNAFLQESSGIAGNTNQITQLPSEVLDEYRGQYGIPTIPNRNTWVLTENLINLPLPGGGNINNPEDFEEFGLKY